MYSKEIKIALSALMVLGVVFLCYIGWWGTGVLLFLLAGIVVLTIFKNEYNMLAFFFMRRGNFEKAESALLKIKHPEKFTQSQHSFYYYLLGIVESQKKSFAKSERYFKRALDIGLRMEHDRAMAKLNLAGFSLSKRNKREAMMHLAEAKKLDKNKMLTDQVKMIEAQLKRI